MPRPRTLPQLPQPRTKHMNMKKRDRKEEENADFEQWIPKEYQMRKAIQEEEELRTQLLQVGEAELYRKPANTSRLLQQSQYSVSAQQVAPTRTVSAHH